MSQLEKIREIAIVLEERVPSTNDAGMAAIDAGDPSLPSVEEAEERGDRSPERQEPSEDPDAELEEDFEDVEESQERRAEDDSDGQSEMVDDEASAPIPEYEPLEKSGAESGADAEEVAAPLNGSDPTLEETRGPVPA